jgi:hypothetical protein
MPFVKAGRELPYPAQQESPHPMDNKSRGSIYFRGIGRLNMESKARSAIAGGTILILLGVFFLIIRVIPGFLDVVTWPFIIIGVGVVFLVMAIVKWTPGLAIPGCIIGGIGGILFWQNLTGQWVSWTYAWALIPGFVGVGILAAELLEGKPVKALVDGGWLILISLVLFFLFGWLFGSIPWFGSSWAIILIVIGVLIILRPILGIDKKSNKKQGDQ